MEAERKRQDLSLRECASYQAWYAVPIFGEPMPVGRVMRKAACESNRVRSTFTIVMEESC